MAMPLLATDLNASVCFDSSTHQQVSSAEPKIKTEALKDRLQYSSENLLEGDVESRGERLRDSFDVMIVGDLFYDQDIGDAICRLTAAFQVQVFWVNPNHEFHYFVVSTLKIKDPLEK